jgi:hypothetical protein
VFACRPDIAFYASELAAVTKPQLKHIRHAQHLIRYLVTTNSFGILYQQGRCSSRSTASTLLLGASDSDWAADKITRRSHSGAIVYFNGSPIDWLSRRQPGVAAQSADDAELTAATPLISRLDFIRMLLRVATFPLRSMDLLIDNQVGKAIVTGPSISKARHSSIRAAFVKDYVDYKHITPVYVPTGEQPADLLTKPAKRHLFTKARALLPVSPPPVN